MKNNEEKFTHAVTAKTLPGTPIFCRDTFGHLTDEDGVPPAKVAVLVRVVQGKLLVVDEHKRMYFENQSEYQKVHRFSREEAVHRFYTYATEDVVSAPEHARIRRAKLEITKRLHTYVSKHRKTPPPQWHKDQKAELGLK